MEELTIMLNNVKDSYYGFVVAVLTYVNNKPSRLDFVMKYLDNNPQASTSEILSYISEQEDFYDDVAFSHAQNVQAG